MSQSIAAAQRGLPHPGDAELLQLGAVIGCGNGLIFSYLQ
jgi:hypothetical protein